MTPTRTRTAAVPDRRASTAAAPLRRPDPRPERHGVRPARAPRRDSTRLVGVVGVVSVIVVLIGLFGMAAFHAVIIEGQRDLERLDAHAVELRAENDRLEVEVAALLAPGRIEAEAKARLGMVDPTDVTYLAPVPAGSAVPGGQ
ncbi:MAG: septum formation initiator family protein [Acidimicrobiales bacterium]